MKTGELIIGAVINRTASGMMLKVLCTAGPTSRYVADINVKVLHNILKLELCRYLTNLCTLIELYYVLFYYFCCVLQWNITTFLTYL